MDTEQISAELRYAKRSLDVRGATMAYIEAGQGNPIVFLHGNPTSSYLWRNIIPHVEGLGRCIAPDLMGMGDSAKLTSSDPARYGFVEQRAYLEALFEALAVRGNVTFVLHDWGSVFGFDWACRHRGAVAGLVYMEAVVRPVGWEDMSETSAKMFNALRSAAGEQLILAENMYVERALPGMVLRALSPGEMEAYRAPFRTPGESRRAILTLCRDVPVNGTPKSVWDAEAAYADWLSTSPIPKLFINADPGAFLVDAKRDFCRTWPNQSEITVRGLHFLQEDSPHEIGAAISKWLRR